MIPNSQTNVEKTILKPDVQALIHQAIQIDFDILEGAEVFNDLNYKELLTFDLVVLL